MNILSLKKYSTIFIVFIFFAFNSYALQVSEKFILKDCNTTQEIKNTFEVMRQLRTKYSNIDSYVKDVKRLMKTENYKLTGLYEKDNPNKCIGAIGYQVVERLYPGKFMYIADLVVDSKIRRQKLGSMLMEYVEEKSKHIPGLVAIILESGIERKEAHKFYEYKGYEVKSLSFRRWFE